MDKTLEQETAEFYKESSKKIAEIVLDLRDIQMRAEHLSNVNNDNGDPGCAIEDAITKLAEALAWTVSYSSSYEEDAQKKEK